MADDINESDALPPKAEVDSSGVPLAPIFRKKTNSTIGKVVLTGNDEPSQAHHILRSVTPINHSNNGDFGGRSSSVGFRRNSLISNGASSPLFFNTFRDSYTDRVGNDEYDPLTGFGSPRKLVHSLNRHSPLAVSQTRSRSGSRSSDDGVDSPFVHTAMGQRSQSRQKITRPQFSSYGNEIRRTQSSFIQDGTKHSGNDGEMGNNFNANDSYQLAQSSTLSRDAVMLNSSNISLSEYGPFCTQEQPVPSSIRHPPPAAPVKGRASISNPSTGQKTKLENYWKGIIPAPISNPFLPERPRTKGRVKVRPPLHVDPDADVTFYVKSFEELSFIGRGGFSEVFRVRSRIDGCTYAVKKRMKKLLTGVSSSSAARISDLREVLILAAISSSSPHIVRYYNAWTEELQGADYLYIQSELAWGSLEDAVIGRRPAPISSCFLIDPREESTKSNGAFKRTVKDSTSYKTTEPELPSAPVAPRLGSRLHRDLIYTQNSQQSQNQNEQDFSYPHSHSHKLLNFFNSASQTQSSGVPAPTVPATFRTVSRSNTLKSDSPVPLGKSQSLLRSQDGSASLVDSGAPLALSSTASGPGSSSTPLDDTLNSPTGQSRIGSRTDQTLPTLLGRRMRDSLVGMSSSPFSDWVAPVSVSASNSNNSTTNGNSLTRQHSLQSSVRTLEMFGMIPLSPVDKDIRRESQGELGGGDNTAELVEKKRRIVPAARSDSPPVTESAENNNVIEPPWRLHLTHPQLSHPQPGPSPVAESPSMRTLDGLDADSQLTSTDIRNSLKPSPVLLFPDSQPSNRQQTQTPSYSQQESQGRLPSRSQNEAEDELMDADEMDMDGFSQATAFSIAPNGNIQGAEMRLAERAQPPPPRIPLKESDVLCVLSHISSALAAMHMQGFVHLDVKPSNILVFYEAGARSCDLDGNWLPEVCALHGIPSCDENLLVQVDQLVASGQARHLSSPAAPSEENIVKSPPDAGMSSAINAKAIVAASIESIDSLRTADRGESDTVVGRMDAVSLCPPISDTLTMITKKKSVEEETLPPIPVSLLGQPDVEMDEVFVNPGSESLRSSPMRSFSCPPPGVSFFGDDATDQMNSVSHHPFLAPGAPRPEFLLLNQWGTTVNAEDAARLDPSKLRAVGRVVYKLGDLGQAAPLSEVDPFEGDSRYLSRELLIGNTSNLCASDIFSLGISAIELLVGLPLPSGGDEYHFLRDGGLPRSLLPSASDELFELLCKMVHPNPSERPTAAEVYAHPLLVRERERQWSLGGRSLDALAEKEKDLNKKQDKGVDFSDLQKILSPLSSHTLSVISEARDRAGVIVAGLQSSDADRWHAFIRGGPSPTIAPTILSSPGDDPGQLALSSTTPFPSAWRKHAPVSTPAAATAAEHSIIDLLTPSPLGPEADGGIRGKVSPLPQSSSNNNNNTINPNQNVRQALFQSPSIGSESSPSVRTLSHSGNSFLSPTTTIPTTSHGTSEEENGIVLLALKPSELAAIQRDLQLLSKLSEDGSNIQELLQLASSTISLKGDENGNSSRAAGAPLSALIAPTPAEKSRVIGLSGESAFVHKLSSPFMKPFSQSENDDYGDPTQ